MTDEDARVSPWQATSSGCIVSEILYDGRWRGPMELAVLPKKCLQVFLERLRHWDYHACKRPYAYIANSEFVAERIARIYGRNATVIYPPVDVERFLVKAGPGGEYFVTLERFVPYKNIDRIVYAFRSLPHTRIPSGSGPIFYRAGEAVFSCIGLEECRAFFPGNLQYALSGSVDEQARRKRENGRGETLLPVIDKGKRCDW